MLRPLILLTLATPAAAQQAPDQPTIQVTGQGKVSTPPDVATIVYYATGEGKTADEATTALAAKHKAIAAALEGLLGRGTEVTSGEVSVIETRSPACDGSGGYNSKPRLSEGACAVTGYIATIRGQARTGAVTKAGTAAGLAARLGARDARIESFALSDPAAAQRRAAAAAIRDARTKAEAAAEGAGVKLGPILTITDQAGYGMPVPVGLQMVGALPAPPPPPPPPPVEIAVKPRPVDTQQQIYVRFAIER